MLWRLTRLLVPAAAVVLGLGASAPGRSDHSSAAQRDLAAVALLKGPTLDCAVTGTLNDGVATDGETVYRKKCAACHGALGDGQGKQGKKLDHKPKPWNSKEAWEKTTDKVKFQATKCGGKAVSKSDDMPDYPELTDQQIWNVIAYAKTLSSPGSKP